MFLYISLHIGDEIGHEMKCPVYKTYLEEKIANQALNAAGPKYDRLLAEGHPGWLQDEDFEPITGKINMVRGNQVVIPGQQFQQLIRYINEEVTEKILKQTQRTQDRGKRDIDIYLHLNLYLVSGSPDPNSRYRSLILGTPDPKTRDT